MATLTSRQHKTTLKAGAVQIPGNWKTISGGALTIEVTKNKPGGMEDEEVIANTPSREDLTITREYRTERDAGLIGPGGTLEVAAKTDATCVVTSQDIGYNEQGVVSAIGTAKTYTGKITSVSRGDRDSESNEVDTLTVVLSVVA